MNANTKYLKKNQTKIKTNEKTKGKPHNPKPKKRKNTTMSHNKNKNKNKSQPRDGRPVVRGTMSTPTPEGHPLNPPFPRSFSFSYPLTLFCSLTLLFFLLLPSLHSRTPLLRNVRSPKTNTNKNEN